MRIAPPLLLAAAVACAGPGATRRPSVDAGGREAVVAGKTWRAQKDVTLFERGGRLHVVSLVPGNVFDVALEIGPDGRPIVPPDAPFEVKDGTISLRERSAPPTVKLVDSGQLYRHDDHFHLTHRYENADWQALYRARAEDSPLSPAMRTVAAAVLSTLLDARLAGGSEEATALAMRRTEKVIALARRAVEAELPSKQIMAMVLHDLEIRDDGRTLAIEGATWRAGEGIRFAYCGDHFHVESASGAWVHAIPLADAPPGRFELPPSMFFAAADGKVSARAGAAPWTELLASRQIRLSGDGWYLAERYANPALVRLEGAANDAAVPAPLREAARRGVVELLNVRLDIDSDAAFRASLAALDARIERRWKELERDLPAARRR